MTEPTHKRADANLHRQQLLDAADKVFSEHGVHVALELVTTEAGVSRATLYRNFPDREALMMALLERAFSKLEAMIEALQGEEDAFFKLLAAMSAMIVDSAPVADYWRATDRNSPVLHEAQERLQTMLDPLIRHAVDSRRCRADLRVEDVVLLTNMLGASSRGKTRDERVELSKRALTFILHGLSGPPGS